MAQTRVVLNNQDFLCPICLDLLRAPVTLPCGHNYCSYCIREYWLLNNGLQTVSCPQCRETFTPAPLLRPNIVLAETVERLRSTRQQRTPSAASIVSLDTNIPPPRGSPDGSSQQQQASGSTARNVQNQQSSSSRERSVQQQQASGSGERTIQQNHTFSSRDRSAQQSRTSSSRDRSAQQQQASGSAASNIQQQHASGSRERTVQQNRTSSSHSRSAQQNRTSSSRDRSVQQQRASGSTASIIQQHRVSSNQDQRVQQHFVSGSHDWNTHQPPASVSSERSHLLQGTSGSATILPHIHIPSFSPNTQPCTCGWVLCARVLAMLFACVAFSVAVDSAVDGELVTEEPMAKWCILAWGLSFSGSALLLLVELCGLQSRLPLSWKDLTITFASYASLLCLSNTIIFGVHFVTGFTGHSYSAHATSLAFSCLATITYLMEVIKTRHMMHQDRVRQDGTSFMATWAGLLKVCETFVAGVIFVFISDPIAYESHEAIKWCMAVYCVCFILSSVVILLSIGNFIDSDSHLLLVFFTDLLSVIMYLTAMVIWPIYKRNELIVVAVLTSLNFLLYLMGLICFCCTLMA